MAAAIAAAIFTAYESRWGLALRGVASIHLENRSAAPVEKVAVRLSSGTAQWTRRIERLEPGAIERISIKTPDLYVFGVDYTIDGRRSIVEEGGAACPGEILMMRILDHNQIECAPG